MQRSFLYLHAGGWPDRQEAVQKNEGFSSPTRPKQTAACLQSGRCWKQHRGAKTKQHTMTSWKLAHEKPLKWQLPWLTHLLINTHILKRSNNSQSSLQSLHQSEAQSSCPQPSLPPGSSPQASHRSLQRWTPAPLHAPGSSDAPPGPLHRAERQKQNGNVWILDSSNALLSTGLLLLRNVFS